MTFEQWMQETDDSIWTLIGCSIHDLPDCPFRDWYEDELTPGEAAVRAVKGAI